MKRFTVIILGILCANISFSQNETDALRYSYLNYFGTARYMGLGGAMGAYGKDMSAITLNPAGQAGYNWNEFSISGNVTATGINTFYNGKENSHLKGNYNTPNWGLVFAISTNAEKISNWRKFQIGYSRTRINDFVGKTVIKGNHTNSMLNSYVNNIQGLELDELSDLYEGLAYDAYLIDYDTTAKEYYAYTASQNIDQEKTITTSGYQHANDITFSGNYKNKLYVGGSVGFPSSKFNQVSTYTERFKGDTVYDLERFTLEEELNTVGSGVNAKIGVIYMPIKSLRLGMAVHTGTYYAMTDKYQNSIISDFTDNNYDSEVESDEGEYNYSIKTPARYIASIAFLIKKRGYISVEYEYADYKNAKLNADDYNFDTENKVVKEIYQGASILKAGAEFRVTNNWTARAGYSYYSSPIKSDFEDVDNSRTNISGGFGYKNRKYSLDFAYTRSMTNSSHYLYDPALVNPTEINTNLNNFVVTAAFRF